MTALRFRWVAVRPFGPVHHMVMAALIEAAHRTEQTDLYHDLMWRAETGGAVMGAPIAWTR